MIVQRFVVLLAESPAGTTGRDVRQIWLGYDDMGRIGNANFDQAFRYDTKKEAILAVWKFRKSQGKRKWGEAEIFGTTVEVEG